MVMSIAMISPGMKKPPHRAAVSPVLFPVTLPGGGGLMSPAKGEMNMEADQRGIILTTKMSVSEKAFSLFDGGLDPHLVRAAMLFWDLVDFPDFRIFDIHDPAVDYLESVGMLQRTSTN